MNRKTRLVLANSIIATASLVGGATITQALTAELGGFGALFSSNTGSTASGGSDQTVTGDAISYQYGTIQVELVRSGGKITNINLKQAGANGGREQAFPTLVQAALDAQGTNFGNVSGATFTTQAFKQAVDSAISKLS